jgi:hypothetical protein
MRRHPRWYQASLVLSVALLSAGLAAVPHRGVAQPVNDEPAEVEELRTETSETFLSEDGSFTTTYFAAHPLGGPEGGLAAHRRGCGPL